MGKSDSLKKKKSIGTDKILLLSDEDLARELVSRLEVAEMTCVCDKEDALTELSKRSYSAVMLSGDRDDVEDITRAIRKLNRHAKLLAICDSRHDPAQSLSEYFDFVCTVPTTRVEAKRLLRQIDGNKKDEPRRINLELELLSQLISATSDTETLEATIIEVLNRKFRVNLKWVEPDAIPKDSQSLLVNPSTGNFLIIDNSQELPRDADRTLEDLQELLSPLCGVMRRMEALHCLAITDYLTGAYNRRYFYYLVDNILRESEPEDFRATLLLYDIDNFKQYNDRFGHAVGDEILRDTAAMMKSITREQDIVARIGGDEFAVLFWDRGLRFPKSKPLEDALDLADRFRKAIESMEFESLGSDAGGALTISGGLANFPEHGQTCLELLRQADRGLRDAKTSGKNNVRLVGE